MQKMAPIFCVSLSHTDGIVEDVYFFWSVMLVVDVAFQVWEDVVIEE
jgi:hypothetical protein